MDLLLKENFELKREIVFERKKYVDLQQAYKDLKMNVQQNTDVSNSPDGKQPRISYNQKNIVQMRPSANSSNSGFD